MNKYEFDEESGGILLLDTEDSFSKEPRPVYAPEMNLLGFDRYWRYENQSEVPYLWAEASNYFYRGKKIARTQGGSLSEPPTLEVEPLVEFGEKLLPVDIEKMAAKNHDAMLALQQFTIKRIYNYWRRWKDRLDCFHVAFSGGKDSVVLLDLVARALPKSAFIVVFGDTEMEFPDTYKLIDAVEARCKKDGIAFYRASANLTPEESWEIFGPPAKVLRWCCSVHKAAPQTLKIRELLGKKNFVGADFVGVRRHESLNRADYEVENIGRKQKGQHSHNSILEWNSAEIWLYIFANNLPVNDAYKKGNSRVGCLFCPMISGRASFFRKISYPAETEKFMSYIRHAVSDENIESYITKSGWINRRNGRDLLNAPNNYAERRDEKYLYITVENPAADWREWIKTLGEIPFPYEISATDTGCTVKVPLRYERTSELKFFKSVFHKSAVCVGCGVCESNCRFGAISFADGLKIKNCVHCLQCHEIERGCILFHSTELPSSAQTKTQSRNAFADHAPKPEWIKSFFENPARFMAVNYFKSNDSLGVSLLGVNQKDFFQRFLFDAGLIERKDKEITSFTLKLKKIGWNSAEAWGLILVNLAYSNPQIRWYIDNMPVNETFPRSFIEENLKALSISDKDSKSIIKAFGRLCEIPLGTALNFGTVTTKGKIITTLARTKAKIFDGRVILYALYNFAESADGLRQFNLTRLMSTDTDELTPAKIFGINRAEMESFLNGLAVNYPHFISVSFTHDLEKISLAEDKSAAEVLDLFD